MPDTENPHPERAKPVNEGRLLVGPIGPMSNVRHNANAGLVTIPFEDWKLIRGVVDAALAFSAKVSPSHDHYEPPNECDDCTVLMAVSAYYGQPVCGECGQYTKECRGECLD